MWDDINRVGKINLQRGRNAGGQNAGGQSAGGQNAGGRNTVEPLTSLFLQHHVNSCISFMILCWIAWDKVVMYVCNYSHWKNFCKYFGNQDIWSPSFKCMHQYNKIASQETKMIYSLLHKQDPIFSLSFSLYLWKLFALASNLSLNASTHSRQWINWPEAV